MGLHKADFIFHSRPLPHYADNPRFPFPLPETAVSIDHSLHRVDHRS